MDYLLTWTTYGTWLHGDPRQSVDRHHNTIGMPAIPANPKLAAFERQQMTEPAYQLSARAAAQTVEALRNTCEIRGWFLFAAHARNQHVHAVLRAAVDGSVALGALKANATRVLKPLCPGRTKFWTRSGSIRRLVTEQARANAIAYVADGQGKPMAMFVPDEW